MNIIRINMSIRAMAWKLQNDRAVNGILEPYLPRAGQSKGTPLTAMSATFGY
jgi:hypothetical protein